jgi:hypothetical protein
MRFVQIKCILRRWDIEFYVYRRDETLGVHSDFGAVGGAKVVGYGGGRAESHLGQRRRIGVVGGHCRCFLRGTW